MDDAEEVCRMLLSDLYVSGTQVFWNLLKHVRKNGYPEINNSFLEYAEWKGVLMLVCMQCLEFGIETRNKNAIALAIAAASRLHDGKLLEEAQRAWLALQFFSAA